jgi:glycosyltransferase involved in cell wall biosynthesis
MKILFVSNTPDSRTGGMGRIMHHLRDEMEKNGHKVDLIFQEGVPQLPFRRLSELLYPWLLLPILCRKWGKGRPDIVAIHSLEAGPYVFFRRFNKKLPPCVLVSYGSDELRWEVEKEEDRLGFRKLRLFSKLFYYNLVIRAARSATRHADHVMVAARNEIDFYENRYGVPRERVTFVPNGVSESFFIRRNYARPANKLLYLGGWEWRKGIRYLASAFEELAGRYPQLTLSLVGIGVSEIEAKSLFPEAIRDRIHVVPHVSADRLPQVYAEHDIFVFPSLFESMSLVVPEAMASGMPVVTTRACGMQDIIEDQVHGLLVPPRDAQLLAEKIETLRQDAALRQRLGTAAQERARAITWDKIAYETIDLYKKVLGRS